MKELLQSEPASNFVLTHLNPIVQYIYIYINFVPYPYHLIIVLNAIIPVELYMRSITHQCNHLMLFTWKNYLSADNLPEIMNVTKGSSTPHLVHIQTLERPSQAIGPFLDLSRLIIPLPRSSSPSPWSGLSFFHQSTHPFFV